jgi:hypothetical protein
MTAPFFRTDGTVDHTTSIYRQSPELGNALHCQLYMAMGQHDHRGEQILDFTNEAGASDICVWYKPGVANVDVGFSAIIPI